MKKPITKTKSLWKAFEMITSICQTKDEIVEHTIYEILKRICDEAYMDGKEDGICEGLQESSNYILSELRSEHT